MFQRNRDSFVGTMLPTSVYVFIPYMFSCVMFLECCRWLQHYKTKNIVKNHEEFQILRRTIKNYFFDSKVNPSQNSAYNQSKAYKKRIFFTKKKFKISCGEGVVEAVEDSVVFNTFLSAIFQDGGKDKKCASHSIQYFILNISRPRRSKSVEKWECETKKTKKTIFRWKKVPKTTPPHNSIGEGDGSKRTWGN